MTPFGNDKQHPNLKSLCGFNGFGLLIVSWFTFSDLVSRDIQWGVRDRGGWPDWFKDSNVKKYKFIWIFILCANFSQDELSQKIYKGFVFVKSIEEGVQKVRKCKLVQFI